MVDVGIRKGVNRELAADFEETGVLVLRGDILRSRLDLEF